MADRIEITINDWRVKAVNREPLINVCRREGIDVPTLCHHDRIKPYGVCRVCMVKVSWGRKSKYVTACNYPVENDDVVDTESRDVMSLRKMSIEALLGRCPNEREIVEFAASHGVTSSRFPPHKPGGDDCILCGLCVGVCNEVVGAKALGFMERGPEREVVTPFMEFPESCIACGACSALCPTTKMTMERQKTEILKSRHGDIRPCRYALMGLYPGGICANNYRCHACDVDQKYREIAGDEHPVFMARSEITGGGEAA
jgi:predicted molibdopterin-dependent oxidoreductase YjgC